MRRLAIPALAALALVVVGCGGGDDSKSITAPTATMRATTPSTAPAARAFRTHAAAAVTALREGIEEPYRDGAFEGDPVDVILAFAKAGSAASTAVGELTKAVQVASGDGGLPELAAQAQSLLTRLPALIVSAKDGRLDTDEIAGFLDDLDALGQTVSAAGLPVPGTTTTTP